MKAETVYILKNALSDLHNTIEDRYPSRPTGNKHLVWTSFAYIYFIYKNL